MLLQMMLLSVYSLANTYAHRHVGHLGLNMQTWSTNLQQQNRNSSGVVVLCG